MTIPQPLVSDTDIYGFLAAVVINDEYVNVWDAHKIILTLRDHYEAERLTSTTTGALPMTLDELKALFEEAIKITSQEAKMRKYVFQNDPQKLQAKLAEIERLTFILVTFKDALKATFPPTPEQHPLLDLPPKKHDYP